MKPLLPIVACAKRPAPKVLVAVAVGVVGRLAVAELRFGFVGRAFFVFVRAFGDHGFARLVRVFVALDIIILVLLAKAAVVVWSS